MKNSIFPIFHFFLPCFIAVLLSSDSRAEETPKPKWFNSKDLSEIYSIKSVDFPNSGPHDLEDGHWFKVRKVPLKFDAQRKKELTELISSSIKKKTGMTAPLGDGIDVSFLLAFESGPAVIISFHTSIPEVVKMRPLALKVKDYVAIKFTDQFLKVSSPKLALTCAAIILENQALLKK